MKNTKPVFETSDDCLALAEEVNPKREPLTPEKLKTFPGCEHYTNEQAASIVQTLDQLAVIFFDSVIKKRSTCIDNQHIVYLNPEAENVIIKPNKIAV